VSEGLFLVGTSPTTVDSQDHNKWLGATLMEIKKNAGGVVGME